jgi:hypothetical protein
MTWLFYGLLTGKQVLMKLQQSKFDISNPNLILEHLSNFLQNFNVKQQEHCSQQFYYVASLYTDYLLQGHAEAISGIHPILSALKKI